MKPSSYTTKANTRICLNQTQSHAHPLKLLLRLFRMNYHIFLNVSTELRNYVRPECVCYRLFSSLFVYEKEEGACFQQQWKRRCPRSTQPLKQLSNTAVAIHKRSTGTCTHTCRVKSSSASWGPYLPLHVSVTQAMIIRLIQSLLRARHGDEAKAGRHLQMHCVSVGLKQSSACKLP